MSSPPLSRLSEALADSNTQRNSHQGSHFMDVQSRQLNESKPYLSPKQQDLLLAALHSQAGNGKSSTTNNRLPSSTNAHNRISGSRDNNSTMTGDEAKALFMSPQDAELENYDDVDFTPDLDYLDGDTGYDFENTDLGGEMIGALPGSGADPKDNPSEKRKNPDEDGVVEEGDAKRHETQEGEKTAKKPGRKPLTSEPTTKRKAQNRAAQRAFRERKEKHLKDLETKVAELTKAQEADKHENGLLKAQVDRLQVELREYKKRMSQTASGTTRSPPMRTHNSQARSNSNPLTGSSFQFDFPKFGALPGSQIFGNPVYNSPNQSVSKRHSTTPSTTTHSPPVTSRHGSHPISLSGREDSMNRSLSPGSSTGSPAHMANLASSLSPYSGNNTHGFAGTLPQMGGGNDPLSDLFSPSILKTAGMNNYFANSESPEANSNESSGLTRDVGGDNSSGFSRVFQFNSGSSVSDTTSPGGSSLSQWNMNAATNSSCGTSPEPSHESPANKNHASDAYSGKLSPHLSFADNGQGLNTDFGLQTTYTDPLSGNDYSMPVGNFDPVLFGDYRESQDAIIGNGDFTGGFFDDALNSASFDYGSPSNLFGILQSPQQTNKPLNNKSASAPKSSKSLMAEMDKVRDGGDDDYGLVHAQPKTDVNNKMISCNNIWNQLQSNPDFQDGKFDLDSLCSELRMKARCSESGVMVDQNHVDAALKKLGSKDQNGKVYEPSSTLVFEQESWDKVLKKLGGSGRV